MALNRRQLQATVLFMVVFLTPAIQSASIIRTAMQEIKELAVGLIKYMQQESTCVQEPGEPLSVGSIKKPKADSVIDCSLILTFDAYFSEAIVSNRIKEMPKKLKAIKQRTRDLHRRICEVAPTAKSYNTSFIDESDGDYEKFCKVLSLAKLLKLWLDQPLN